MVRLKGTWLVMLQVAAGGGASTSRHEVLRDSVGMAARGGWGVWLRSGNGVVTG